MMMVITLSLAHLVFLSFVTSMGLVDTLAAALGHPY